MNKDSVIENGKVKCTVTGRQMIERYVFGDKDLSYPGLSRQDPASRSRTIASSASSSYDTQPGRHGPDAVLAHLLPRARRPADRLGDLERVRQLRSEHEPPDVLLDFNRFGSRVFGDVTDADRRHEVRDDPRRQGQVRADHQRRDPRWSRGDHHGRRRRRASRSASATSSSPCSRRARCRRRSARSRREQGRPVARRGRDRQDAPVVRDRHRARHHHHGRHLQVVGHGSRCSRSSSTSS